MKGLRKFLTPFAPDISGAVSVLFELGGIIVICDAGGCTGNVCGFDEPRWFGQKSAVFSAGLRDMDAIMGEDERLAGKIADAAKKISANFIALVGTPVPAVIGTDYIALKHMVEKKTGLTVLAVDTNGMELYDRGEQKALLAAYDAFAREKLPEEEGRINIMGMTPHDAAPDDFGACHLSLDEIRSASAARQNIVCSPAAIPAAKLLRERFGTPYVTEYPGIFKSAKEISKTPAGVFGNVTEGILAAAGGEEALRGRSVLIVHQHVLAHSLKSALLQSGARNVRVACWFMAADEIREKDDVFLAEEDDFTLLVSSGSFDVIIADEALRPLAGDFRGTWIDFAHFALSGRTPRENPPR